jgi:hypothetical protein
MRRSNPPRLASWMLHHLTPGERNEALAGDLLEEFRSGRSASWYWHQVISAVCISCRRMLSANRTPLLFAALWSLGARAVCTMDQSVASLPAVLEELRHISWPLSGILALSLRLLPRLAFIWAGILFYYALKAGNKKPFNPRSFMRGIARSSSVFLPLLATSFAIALPFSIRPTYIAAWHNLAHVNAVAVFGASAALATLPYFLTTLFAIWIAPQTRRTDRPARS